MNIAQIKFSIIVVLFTLSCDQSGRSKKNIIQVKEFGDTMRLEVEKKGDTLIKHYIDLRYKKKQGDKFDNSYTEICTYQNESIDTTVIIDGLPLKIKKYLIENYETEFSSGQNFYFITEKSDTIFKEHRLIKIR